jgi:hypothetical protein
LLDPITDTLRAAGIPHTVDQTGGFVMLVNVPCVEDGSQHLWLEGRDDFRGGDDEYRDADGNRFAAYGFRYDVGSDGCRNCYGIPVPRLAGHEEEPHEYLIPLAELVDVCRREWRHVDVCECEGECADL